MSKSRLEKFLYALYSLDSSDLPTPLSRIEELYKCLVTGDEAPTFEPLSRVEKYLMAILGGYNVNELPNPLSRVEVLLYKLATGDDNLDDVKSFLSEHEELLAEIIRNGGVGGNIDIEYVLHTLSTEFNTLYNTAKKPVKSAILKGATLVNLPTSTRSGNLQANYVQTLTRESLLLLKPSTKYFLKIFNHTSEDKKYTTHPTLFVFQSTPVLANSSSTYIISTNSDVSSGSCLLRNETNHDLDNSLDVLLIEYQEGMENWDIPYFEGMKSVQMPVLSTVGKNLSPINDYETTVWEYIKGYQGFNKVLAKNILIDENKEYCLSFTKECEDGLPTNLCNLIVHFSSIPASSNIDDHNSIYVHCQNNKGKKYAHITMPNMGQGNEYVGKRVTLTNIQLEEGSVATSYEPHKTNILTVNEEVELRGIGDVKDELDLITGELTQHINEVVLDGSEIRHTNNATYMTETSTAVLTAPITNFIIQQPIMCNDLPSYMASEGIWNVKANILSGVSLVSAMWGFCIRLPHTLTGVTTNDSADTIKQKFKAYLQSNPITVQYHLATELVKTVDLSVVDQNGNDTKLSTFDDITHVTLSSEGLIPEAELEVATKNEEDLEDSSVYTTHTLSEEFNTLYNTAEKSVKSAILKGHTLVNLSSATNESWRSNSVNAVSKYFNIVGTEIGKTYTIIVLDYPNKVKKFRLSEDNGVNRQFEPQTIKKITFNSTITDKKMYLYLYSDDGVELNVNEVNDVKLMILEGDYTNVDIPYFTGMQSVKLPVLTTTGKNLNPTSIEPLGLYDSSGTNNNNPAQCRTDDFISVIPNQVLTVSSDQQINRIFGYDVDGNYLGIGNGGNILSYGFADKKEHTFTVPNNCYKIKITSFVNTNTYFQLEEGTIATPYEPYKSNILTTSEEVELRGVGKVEDELNLLTGELTQRVGEVVLDGGEGWSTYVTNEDTISFIGSYIADAIDKQYDSTNLMADKLIASGYGAWTKANNITLNTKRISICVLKSVLEKVDVNGFKKWLSENPIKVQYIKADEPIKTVDLSVVDQDGNNTELSTFNDLTHVTLSSEGLIPKAELEVAEKVPEVAANMLGISREQEVIDTATNEQSENVDSTMIATTEIYEELL